MSLNKDRREYQWLDMGSVLESIVGIYLLVIFIDFIDNHLLLILI